MVATDRARQLFAAARDLQADALDLLALGDVRNAAEKAWGATRMATNALVPARTGEEPERTPESAQGLLLLQAKDGLVREARMVGCYYTRQGHLHGDCFYAGLCEPIDETERRIRMKAVGAAVRAALLTSMVDTPAVYKEGLIDQVLLLFPSPQRGRVKGGVKVDQVGGSTA